MDPATAATVSSRAFQVLLVGVIGVAFVGFVVGTVGPGGAGGTGGTGGVGGTAGGVADAVAPPDAGRSVERAAGVLPATRYQDLAAARPGPNAGFRTSLAGVDRVAGDLFAVAAPDQEAKLASLAQRQARRAYNGAPPVIPHAIDQRSPASCVACHQLTLRVGDIRAARMPHEHLSNCTQCHVESVARFAPPRDLPGNGFQGLPAPTQGQRAWPGAPPTIPHSTFMRSDCLSCHGPGGPEGMQSTHPWRQACQQCHAPSALLDQYAPVERAGFLLPPRIEER